MEADSQPGRTTMAVLERKAMMQRYREAYRVSKSVDLVGKVARGVGAVVGLIGAAFAVAGISDPQTRSNAIGLVVALGCGALGIAGAVFYVMGVLLSAHGQLLMASLDAATHSSPFLSDEEKASAMSLI